MNASEQAKPMDEIDGEIKTLLDQAGPGSVPGTPPGAIEDSAAVQLSQAERERAHHITVQVLLGSSGSFDQNVKHFRVDLPDGNIAKVAFDNASHSSGNRRGYVKCMRHSPPPEGHCACYRYRELRKFPSQKRCVAYLAAWSWEADHPSIYVSTPLSIYESINQSRANERYNIYTHIYIYIYTET